MLASPKPRSQNAGEEKLEKVQQPRLPPTPPILRVFPSCILNSSIKEYGPACERYDINERTPRGVNWAYLRKLSRKKERKWEIDSTSLKPTSPIFHCISHLSTRGRKSQKTYMQVLCFLKPNIRACMGGHSHINMPV